MFCSNCGSKAEGKFCWNCGAKLFNPAEAPAPASAPPTPPPAPAVSLTKESPAAPTPPVSGPGGAEEGSQGCKPLASAAPAPASPPPKPPASSKPVDWQHEVRYEVLLKNPEVRRLVDRHAKAASKAMTGEELLKQWDKLTGGGGLHAVSAQIAQALGTSLGIKTGKARHDVLPMPPGRVIVAALCSTAAAGQTLRGVEQKPDGLLMRFEIPSTWQSMAGELTLLVQREGNATAVDAATHIPGQLFDWGKSAALLDRLFADIRAMPLV
jgi:hypothetical protein